MTTHAGGTNTATRDSGHGLVSGWTAFAAVLMVFGGLMAIFQGISAIAKDNVFVVTRDYSYEFSLTGWGWLHLILGIVVLLAGFALFKGAMWARVTGVLLAGLSMIANFIWLPYYPLWALVLLAIDVFVIWALCAGPRPTT
ncbi:hypothetical protein ACFY41_01190 [Streptomyces syringium]|uniref:Succinate-acetate transporter protein n=1 Tax=Streptomyces syringium TaxID=76729 RepID=A0ABS4XXZ1_9ACTN|nr:hypothetical protein [Streptomyces syringium]MBP2401235.1 succinate-acetate transporter protein [Streptomyces syringium]